jgi:WD40 repeat protein
VRVWDTASGAELCRIAAHADDIDAAAVSPDGLQIASCGHDRSVRFWDLHSGAPLGELAGHGDEVEWVAWDPAGLRVATASLDARVRIFDVADRRCERVLAGRNRAVTAVAVSQDGSLALLQGDRTLRVLDRELRERGAVPDAHARTCRALAWLPGDRALLTAALDASARLWSLPGRGAPALAASWELSAPCHALALDPRDGRFAAGLDDGSIELRRLSDGALLESAREHAEPVYALAWSPDGAWLASGSRDTRIRLRASDGSGSRCVGGHADPVLCLAWSADGSRLASGGRDSIGRVWDRAGALRCELRGHRLTLWGIGFSPDGQQVASSSFDTDVRLWDAASGACLAVLRGHAREVSSLCWARDGRLVTGSRDGTVRVWDARAHCSRVVVPHAA